MFDRVICALGAVALCAVACGVSYGQAAEPRTIHEALRLALPAAGAAAVGEAKLVDRAAGARGTNGCPSLDGFICQCPDFRTAFNVTAFSQYEKLYLDSVFSPFLFDVGWSEVYSGGAGAGIGDVTIAFYEDDNGLPGNLIWFGTDGVEFNIGQSNTGDQLLGFDVYEMFAQMTGGGAGPPNLLAYAGQCIHIGINHQNIPGGADAFWTTSNSTIGDQRHYSAAGLALPSVTDIAADDLQICLDTSSFNHHLGPVLTNCPPPDCTIGEPLAPLTTFENEVDCGSPTDTVNGACNSVPFVTSALPAGEYGRGTIFGTPDLDGLGNWGRDTDHWRMTHEGGEFAVGLSTDFVGFMFAVPLSAPCPYDSADFLGSATVPECSETTYSFGTQPAGDYVVFIAQNPFADFRTLACGEGNYVIWDASPGACPVDVTGDGEANFLDLAPWLFVLKNVTTDPAPASDAWLFDLNSDGTIDLSDFTRFLAEPCAVLFNGGTASSITPTSIGVASVDNSGGAGDAQEPIDPATDATWDLTATVQESGGAMNAFACAELDAELTAPGFSFYQHPLGALFEEPTPTFFPVFPALEFDTFVCAPGDLGDAIQDSSTALSTSGQSFYEVSSDRIRVRWSDDFLRFNDDGTFARLTIRNDNGDGLLAEVVPQGTRGVEQTVIGTITGNVYFSANPDNPVAYAFDIVTNLDLVDPVCVADPVLDAGFCQCPEFSGAWNMTDFSTYEKVHIAAAGASLGRVHWLGGYVDVSVPAGVRSEPGEVTIAMYTDGPDGFPLDLIYIGSDTQGDFVVTQELTNTPTAVSFGSIETYEMTAEFTTLPDLSGYAGSCVHIMIQMTNIPGGYIAAWGVSNSALGDGQILAGDGTNVLPDTIGIDDAAICLDIIERDHVLLDADNCPFVPLGCDGDANGDDVIDVNDISYVLFRLGDSGVPGEVDGDANGDGVVDVNDISYVLFRLGDDCPPLEKE